MSLGDKIAELRRQRGWSQENLAERLGVTRQSVSKWESGASVPDLDKIIGLSELFGVTTDYLIKCEGAAEAAPSEAEPADDQHSRYVTASMAREFIELTSANAPKTALAVALFVLSPICLILLSALSELPGAVISEGAAAGLGIAILLIMVAAGVAMLILLSAKISKYEFLEMDSIRLDAEAARFVGRMKAEFEKPYYLSVAAGVALCIIGALPLIVLACMEASDLIISAGVGMLLILVAAAVYLFVRFGGIRSAYNKLLQEEDYTPENKEVERSTGTFTGIYWCVITAAYLGVSFVTSQWDRTWIIWPVAGVLFAALRAIAYSVIKNKK